MLRQHGCLQVLLHHLRSPSLTVVSNACGTLWNLSARCKEDQAALRELGAVPMLRSLVHSRHKLIATASAAALKNLDSYAAGSSGTSPLGGGGGHSASLQARKQKALEQEIDRTLTEMCDHVEPPSPLEPSPFDRRMYRSLGGHNTGGQYGRSSTAPALAPKAGSAPVRQARSSSLERKGEPRPANQCSAGLRASRTAWHSHENETGYGSPNYEEDDQPVNYSLKYAEEVGVGGRWTRPANAPPQSASDAEPEGKERDEQIDPATVKKALVLSAYRETDLDEPERPTDFSLRYQEEDDYAADNDTMQTYCIEGTPYETPFTRSSAASLTDLREAGLEGPKPDGAGVEAFCEKREAVEQAAGESKAAAGEEKEAKTPPMPRRAAPPTGKEGKTVTFNTTAETECNYAEQTPLMFSRSSSLASLDSLDQQQNCADEGSVVSEFSRLTSRAVSPSELPDSPGQTMPSSPRRPDARQPPPPPQQSQQPVPVAKAAPPPQQPEPCNVFEDATNNFGIEGTPAFTRAASPLSNLSFDDEPASPAPPAAVPVQAAAPPLPNTVAVSQPPLVNPTLNRVARSTSEVNFRSSFDYDEVLCPFFKISMKLIILNCSGTTVQRGGQPGADAVHESELTARGRRSDQHGKVGAVPRARQLGRRVDRAQIGGGGAQGGGRVRSGGRRPARPAARPARRAIGRMERGGERQRGRSPPRGHHLSRHAERQAIDPAGQESAESCVRRSGRPRSRSQSVDGVPAAADARAQVGERAQHRPGREAGPAQGEHPAEPEHGLVARREGRAGARLERRRCRGRRRRRRRRDAVRVHQVGEAHRQARPPAEDVVHVEAVRPSRAADAPRQSAVAPAHGTSEARLGAVGPVAGRSVDERSSIHFFSIF